MYLHEELIKIMEEEIKDLRELYKKDPELAKKKARENLQKAGIMDENGNLLPPYNGQKVNDTDFTMGPDAICLEDKGER